MPSSIFKVSTCKDTLSWKFIIVRICNEPLQVSFRSPSVTNVFMLLLSASTNSWFGLAIRKYYLRGIWYSAVKHIVRFSSLTISSEKILYRCKFYFQMYFDKDRKNISKHILWESITYSCKSDRMEFLPYVYYRFGSYLGYHTCFKWLDVFCQRPEFSNSKNSSFLRIQASISILVQSKELHKTKAVEIARIVAYFKTK